jgi:hypothetical protein
MASFMQNWWRKHDMDADGKGCFFIFGLVLLGCFLLGCAFMGFLWFLANLMF